MEELRNLQQIYSLAAGRFNQYDGKDFILPQMFKEQVKEINSNTISYNEYSAIIETRGNQNGVLNIFLPNQWFYIASYFTDFYNELQRYKKEALKIVSKERLKELNGSSLTEQEENRLQQLSLDETSKSYLVRFMTDYSWWSGAKTIDRGDFYVSPILNSARLVNASQSFVADLCAFLADKKELVDSIINGEEKGNYTYNHPHIIHWIQKIYFGTPGSGKSWTIKEKYEKDETKVIRTTFHPDTDYAQFVGCYKPKTYEEDGKKKISYEFTPQAFTEAYVKAWSDLEHPYYLIIEEINRGNCAQIFGDLFQLLDRKEGVSEYPVDADSDLADYICKNLKNSSRTDFPEGVKEGKKLVLPSNLFIWATMNTSDQSLFPIDSAFKRRWDWKYMPIENEGKNWKIIVNHHEYDWWGFLVAINKEVFNLTHSEDKQLGYFFAKAKGTTIDAETLVNKVYFYLWTDVFKDYDYESQKAFRKPNSNEPIAFKDFFEMGKVNEVMAEQVLINLELNKPKENAE